MPDLSGSNYSETDASNNNASPNGWPEGMAPSGLNDSDRSLAGAVKRAYDRDHAGSWCTVGGTANAITLSYSQNPSAYVQGDKFAFKATAKNTGPTTVQVGSLAATNLYKPSASGPIPLSGGEIQVGQIVEIEYDGTQFQLLTGAAVAVPEVALLRGYLSGLTLSNDGTSPNTTIDVATGVCADSTSTVLWKTSALTKVLNSSGVWTAGTSGNGLDTGAKANSTWYHVYAIRKDADGSGDVLYSLSATAPTMPSGYTYFRRIGSIKTDGSGNILAFKQVGDTFYWAATVSDGAPALIGTSASLLTLTVPTGVQVDALFKASMLTSATVSVLFTSPDENDQVPGNALIDLIANTAYASGDFERRTNTSAQIRGRASSSQNVNIGTYGWKDSRGRLQ